MRRLLIAVVLCLVATGASAEIPDNLGAHLTKGYIRPATAQFAASAAAMSGALDRLCQGPDEARLQTVRQRFDDLVDAWFRVYFLRFGPMVATNRFERIFFWPDPRGVILRQVGEVLGERDPDAIDPAKLATKSVAVQGIPALEFVLFGSGSDALLEQTEEGRYRCAYALSISIAIAETAAEVANEWSENGEFAKDFSKPEDGNRLYRSQKEVAAEAVKALAGGTAYLSDVVISPFLGKEPEQARSKRAPLWRSDSTIRAIRSGVEALEDFYIATGFSESLSDTDRWVDGSLRLEMRNVLATLDRLDMPFEDAVMPGPGREALVYTVIALKSLHTTLDTRLAQAVGVSVGFNALDGD